MTRNRRSWAALGIVAALSLVLAAGVVAARWGGDQVDPAALHEAIEEAPLVQVAEIPATGRARARSVFVQRTATGQVCLWDGTSTTSRDLLGGCNDAAEPLGGRPLSISFAYEGGPAVADVSDARLVGLAEASVATVRIVMSDGSARGVVLRRATIAGASYGAFGYRVRPSDLRQGVTPVAVVALDRVGRELDRQATGFTS